ncbi:MAG TPA: DUF6351 family protein [Terriglobales bacterium]|nr:DUF6351 family protein [Terriglobales bacterium]
MRDPRIRRAAHGLAALLLAGLAVFAPAVAGGAGALAFDESGGLRIDVLSNRADLVTGGDALVRVVLPDRVSAARVRVDLNGQDVTSSFAVRADGRFLGLVGGLRAGRNELTARASSFEGDGAGARITITNHPIGGPVFSGPQVQPWICTNVANGLPVPGDAQCDVAPQFRFLYKNTATGVLTPYDPSSPPAAGLVASTTTDQGVTVPYIVRIERGVEDRGIYDIAVLSDPAKPWAPWASQPGWNHKLVWIGGESAGVHHHNGPPKDVGLDMALSRGFMVANNSLNRHGENENMVVSAEAMMMLKEHIAKTYGSIRYTMGTGCSGGSIEQYVMTADYPGLVDGIMPNCSYQDSWTTGNEVGDCHLLEHFFNKTAPGTFTAAQQAAVMGTLDNSACALWDAFFAQGGNPTLASNCELPPNLVYNPATNPTGVRCTPQDYEVAIWGTRPKDGFAKRPVDNVGIQYGLDALNNGDITPDQFVALNQGIGGVDIDLNFQSARTVADPGSVAIAYRAGQVTNGRAWADVPIIDLRGSHNVNDIHTDFHSYAARARLDEANGTHANQVIWTWQGGPGLFQNIVPSPAVALQSFLLMDRWLSAIEADHRQLPLSQKVLGDRPADAVDACFINGQEITDQATCAAAFKFYGDARIAAGGPLADNVMQCQREALDPLDFAVTFTAAQWASLRQTFRTGVCDFNRPGVAQRPSVSWLTFAHGPGGEPLGPAPRSHPLSDS